MTNVSINNTPVQEDLASGESVTVPSGESWDVTIISNPIGGDTGINNETMLNGDLESNHVATLDTVLHDGDTVSEDNSAARIRGWVVRS